ncbi:MAG: hypothetical protein K2X86_13905 [Cytophagaceae bacterium]|nr:hypothetical protein [Cytophagaceae bacterium]
MKKIGKYLPIFFVLLLISYTSKGQKNVAGAGLHEFGGGIGVLNYSGELSPGLDFTLFRPGGMLFYRFNISPVVSLRASVMGGNIHANEKKLSDPVHQARRASFSSLLGEFAGTIEYNFFNYRPKKEVYKYSPFLTTGIVAYSSRYSGFEIGIPLGLGLKYRLNQRINLGLELVARKTFTDYLDGIKSYNIGTHQTANRYDTDWYYYVGFSISWTAYSVICPDNFSN